MDDLNSKYHRPSRPALAIALLVSLLVHAGLLRWFAHRADVEVSSATAAARPSLQISLRALAPHRPEPELESRPESATVTVPEPVASAGPMSTRQHEERAATPQATIAPPLDRTVMAALSGRRPDFSKPFQPSLKRDPGTGLISEQEWGFNPKLHDKLKRARREREAFKAHREAVGKLAAHNFATSQNVQAAYGHHGVSYERVGTGKAYHEFFRQYLGAGQQACWQVERFADGRVVRTQVSCERLEALDWDERRELWVHDSVRASRERAYQFPVAPTFEQTFIQQLSDRQQISTPDWERQRNGSLRATDEIKAPELD